MSLEELSEADSKEDVVRCAEILNSFIELEKEVYLDDLLSRHMDKANLPMLNFYLPYLKDHFKYINCDMPDMFAKAIITDNMELINYWINSGIDFECGSKTFISILCRGKIELAEYLFNLWLENKIKIDISTNIANEVSKANQVSALNWLHDKFLLHHDIFTLGGGDALLSACCACSCDAIKWWIYEARKLGIDVTFQIHQLLLLSTAEKYEPLKLEALGIWTNALKSGIITIDFIDYPLDQLAMFVHKNFMSKAILDFWKDLYEDRLDKLCTQSTLDGAFRYGWIVLISWLYDLSQSNAQVEFIYTENAIDSASQNGHDDCLQFLIDHGFQIYSTQSAVFAASWKGHKNILDLLKKHTDFIYTESTICIASMYARFNVLDWFKNSSLEFKFNSTAITCLIEKSRCNLGICEHILYIDGTNNLKPNVVYHLIKCTDQRIYLETPINSTYDSLETFMDQLDTNEICSHIKTLWFWRCNYEYYDLDKILDEATRQELLNFDSIDLKKIKGDSKITSYMKCQNC